MKPQLILERNDHHLEQEKEKFISNLCSFLDAIDLRNFQKRGRPKSNILDILKCLILRSFNGMSYRRTQSDLKWMYEEELISSIPPRSTLADYSNMDEIKKLIEKMIQFSAQFFRDGEDTLILDSTWFGQKMYSGGYRKVYDKQNAPLKKVRKMHIGCFKNSKIIAIAKATQGSVHDSKLFGELITTVKENGFNVKTLLADAGYSSKINYAICKENNILDVYIDFKRNAVSKRAKSDIWREKLRLFKEKRDVWNESYRFRVLVEGVFSVIKKKNLNYIRAKKPISQDIEVLLKALVYNLTIIGQYS